MYASIEYIQYALIKRIGVNISNQIIACAEMLDICVFHSKLLVAKLSKHINTMNVMVNIKNTGKKLVTLKMKLTVSGKKWVTIKMDKGGSYS